MGRPLEDIIAAAAAGDNAAFRALVEATQGRLFKFCLVLTGDQSRAEDLAQEAYFKILKNLGKLDNAKAFWDWMFRLTRNLYIDALRKQKEELQAEPTDLESASHPEYADAMAVHRALSQFETEERLLLVLVDMEDYSYREAGEVLGLSEDAVRSKLFRIRKKFIETWKGRETK